MERVHVPIKNMTSYRTILESHGRPPLHPCHDQAELSESLKAPEGPDSRISLTRLVTTVSFKAQLREKSEKEELYRHRWDRVQGKKSRCYQYDLEILFTHM